MPDDDQTDDESPPPPGPQPVPESRSEGGDGATAPGTAVGEGHDPLDGAPEPNEPG